MSARQLARFTASCRVAIGAAFVVQPGVWMRPWIGRDASRPEARMLARALGARDLVLGIGALTSSRQDLARWVAGGLVADAVDFAVTVASREHVPPRGRVLVSLVASGGVALGVVALAGTAREGPGV